MSNPSKHVLNLSDHKLSVTEEFVFAHGFTFGILNRNIKREEVFAEFELLYAQLFEHIPVSNEANEALKARLV